MRFLSTKIHGVLDYVMGLVLVGAPWLFGFAAGGPETWIPVVLGISVILYSLITDYELGVTKGISMSTHLWLDGISGLFLAASPWLFNFSEIVYLPHVVLGVAEFFAAITTKTVPSVPQNPRMDDHFRSRGHSLT